MRKDTEKSFGGKGFGGLAAILLLLGGVFTIVLFYFMFQFAEQGNLLMVIITALLIGVISLIVAKGLVYISRHR
ncbi:hypothetical protein RSJ42_04135 [Methanosarcina hadiensis]|uniref:hypothetical protein n=1 Tax=Methanosarcina hadiensis TaxID=3078083 RepID=UPI0039778008